MYSGVARSSYYFHIGLLLRDTNLINAVLFGAEAWYGITKKQLDQIEKIDMMFFKKLFNSSNNVAKEIYFMESGKLPTKYILYLKSLFLNYVIPKSNIQIYSTIT